MEPASEKGILESAKGVASLLAVIAALIFGLGWVVRSIAISRLGLGYIDIPRETAIGAGFGFFFTISPLVFGFEAAYRALGTLAYLVFGFVPSLAAFGIIRLFWFNSNCLAGDAQERMFRYYATALFVQGILVAWYNLRLARRNLNVISAGTWKRPSFILAAVAFLFGDIWLYAWYVVPALTPGLGGFHYERVIMLMKEPPQRCCVTLICDDKDNLIVSSWNEPQFRIEALDATTQPFPRLGKPFLYKIPFSRIVALSTVYPSQKLDLTKLTCNCADDKTLTALATATAATTEPAAGLTKPSPAKSTGTGKKPAGVKASSKEG
ncbi:MAG: hypothetical protein QOJ65_2248 [Fimbriimonadaceae bacterium]|jgi:hypothetical protein|nr:hypothetical protein [Fimbriimonadaceae bacterium]